MGIATSLTIARLFASSGLVPPPSVAWGAPLPESRPGVYVVALTGDCDGEGRDICVDELPEPERARWVPAQPIVYVGRTRQPLHRRLRQFYRHEYGRPSPHRGGQAILLLMSPAIGAKLWVFWAATDHPAAAEHRLIEAFHAEVGRLPFGNRMRGWAVKS